MPNQLHDLHVDEVSLVDHPACASIDNKTGRKRPHALVAMWKRDGESSEEQREEPMSKFEQILKSATSRDEIVEAVRKRAIEKAAASGRSIEKEAAKILTDHPEIYERHEILAKAEPKRFQPKMANLTDAEVELDERARRLMKRDCAMTYPKACSVALQEDPSLYDKYQVELAAGATRPAVEYDAPTMYAKADGGDEACNGCGHDVDATDAFCRNCGDPIGRPTGKKSSKRKA